VSYDEPFPPVEAAFAAGKRSVGGAISPRCDPPVARLCGGLRSDPPFLVVSGYFSRTDAISLAQCVRSRMYATKG